MNLSRMPLMVLKSVIGEDNSAKLRRIYNRWCHATGKVTWPTKSYEVWLLLQTELFLIRPQMMLEFGSGRSTNYLAEYAFKMDAELLSIEEHAHYTNKANRILRESFLPDNLVRHVAVRDGWYDRHRVSQLLGTLEKPIDFLLLDGPSSSGLGSRASQDFAQCVGPFLKSVQLVVVDDVHRPESETAAKELVDSLGLIRYDMRYGKHNAIAFLHSAESDASVHQLPSFLKDLLVPGGVSSEAVSQTT